MGKLVAKRLIILIPSWEQPQHGHLSTTRNSRSSPRRGRVLRRARGEPIVKAMMISVLTERDTDDNGAFAIGKRARGSSRSFHHTVSYGLVRITITLKRSDTPDFDCASMRMGLH